MRRLQNHSQHGFAMIAVMGLMLLMMIYLVTVQSAVQMTMTRGTLSARRQEKSERMTELVTLAAARGAVPTGEDWRVSIIPLPEDHPFWATAGLLKPLPGDELTSVTVRRPAPATHGLFLINRQGRRPGVVTLDGRSQESGVRRQKSEVRSQETGDRRQKAALRRQHNNEHQAFDIGHWTFDI